MTTTPQLKILIVDDSANIRQVIKRYLQTGPNALHATFLEAGDGDAALTMLQEQNLFDTPVDLVFLDWMMPKVTGLEFLAHLRSIPPFQDTPRVIMLTAETYSDQINAALRFNVSAYITKPFTQDELINTVNRVLAEKELRRAV